VSGDHSFKVAYQHGLIATQPLTDQQADTEEDKTQPV
jgi:hypothetical protein